MTNDLAVKRLHNATGSQTKPGKTTAMTLTVFQIHVWTKVHLARHSLENQPSLPTVRQGKLDLSV